MSDILEQINSLTEQFSNLFEVEGLGDPASDVPPSTNKIKQDRKTKNGKVELVSVEDELFPYDGNKREQYRQKIIDTINNMIQGTATLEDLLQIVRQKKMPVKEGFEGAIEILEELINEVSERTKINAYKKRVAQHQELADRETKTANDYAKLGAYEPAINHLKKASDSQKKEFKHRLNTISHDKKFGQDAFNKAQKELYDEWKAKNNVKEGFEGAIEILEELINEVSDKTAQGALDKAKERYNRKGYEASMKLFQGDSKGAIEDGNKAQDEYNKHINMQLRRAKRQGKKLVQDKNDHDSFKIEEAQELLEEIINEVSVGALARAAENSFPSRKKEDDDLEQKRQEIHKEGSKTKSKKKIEKLYNELQDTLGKSIKANRRYNQAKNIVDLNLPKNSKVSVSKLVDSAKKSQVGRGLAHNAGSEVPYEKYKRTLKRVHRANDIADIKPNKLEVDEALKESIQQLSELFDRPDLLDDISKTLTNKTIKQHLENQVKKLLGGKKKKKVACKACEGFEEATALLEEIINEVSMKKWTETAREVIPKRKADFKNKEKAYMKSIGGNEKNPEETWYKLAKGIGYPENKEYYEFKDAVERKNHAEKVSDLNKGSGSASANKVITKANKVADKRYKEDENSDRTWHAANLGNEDPVKSKVWKR